MPDAQGGLPEVVAFTVPVGDRYPSVNGTGRDAFRGGRKSDEYRSLFLAVRKAAHRAMDACGWTAPAPSYVSVEIVRIVSDRRRRDASNLAKAELDALEPPKPGDARDTEYDPNDPDHPFPGLYLNDAFALPSLSIEYDPAGPDRLVIIARRVHPRPYDAVPVARPRESRRTEVAAAPVRTSVPVERPLVADGSIPPGYALCNGVPVPLKDVLERLRSGDGRAMRRR